MKCWKSNDFIFIFFICMTKSADYASYILSYTERAYFIQLPSSLFQIKDAVYCEFLHCAYSMHLTK